MAKIGQNTHNMMKTLIIRRESYHERRSVHNTLLGGGGNAAPVNSPVDGLPPGSLFMAGGNNQGNFMGTAVNKNIAKPSRTERARKHLDDAIGRLEKAIGGRQAAAGNAAELAGELAGLRAENARLSALNNTVSKGLDKTIGRLKTVLEG